MGHGLTARPTLVASSGSPDPEESGFQPEDAVPPLPPPLDGTLIREERVGGGGYGEVYRGYWKPPGKDPILVAIKCLKFSYTGPNKARDRAFIFRVCLNWDYPPFSCWRADYLDTADKARDCNMASSRAREYSSVLRVPARQRKSYARFVMVPERRFMVVYRPEPTTDT